MGQTANALLDNLLPFGEYDDYLSFKKGGTTTNNIIEKVVVQRSARMSCPTYVPESGTKQCFP